MTPHPPSAQILEHNRKYIAGGIVSVNLGIQPEIVFVKGKGAYHRTRCNLNPIDALETYNPREDIFRDIYILEKIGTKQGWSRLAPDEPWQHGYPQEFQDFTESIFHHREPLSNLELARDTIVSIYAAYLSAERNGMAVEIPA